MAVQLDEVGSRLNVSRPRTLLDPSSNVLGVSTVDHQRFLVGILEDATLELVLTRGWAEEIAAEFEVR